jgi:hypothetical protein
MTTLSEARESIYSKFVTEYALTANTNPYCFANETHTLAFGSAAWIRMAVLHQTGGQESLGGVGDRKFMRAGQVVFQVFEPLNAGTSATDRLVQDIRLMFEGARIAGNTVRFTDAQINEVGVSDGWYQTNLNISFEYDEQR